MGIDNGGKLNKWELTKGEVDKMGIDKVGIDKGGKLNKWELTKGGS